LEELTPYFPYLTKIKKEIHDAAQPKGIRNQDGSLDRRGSQVHTLMQLGGSFTAVPE
jgi:hypothetical protein